MVVSLIPGEQAHWIEISDADIKALRERRTRYVTPESRHVQQIVFPNADDANAASERIAKGTTFADIAKERGLTDKDIDLGTLTKAAMIDKAVADAAFALKEDEVSTPVQGRFGTRSCMWSRSSPRRCTRSRRSRPNCSRTRARARQGRHAVASTTRSRTSARTARRWPRPPRNSSSPRTVEARPLRPRPRRQSGRRLPDAQRLLASAFNTDIGVENDPLQFEGGYVWFEVAGITPARDRTLDEVKDRVEARWLEEEIANRLEAKATEILDKLKAGRRSPMPPPPTGSRSRPDRHQARRHPAPLSAAAVDVDLPHRQGALGSADAAQPGEQIVFRVTDIVTPALDLASDEPSSLQDTFTRTFADDMFANISPRSKTRSA